MTHRSLTAFIHHATTFPKELQIFSATAVLYRTAESIFLIALPVFFYKQALSIPLISALPATDFQKGMLAIVLYHLLPRLVYLAVFPLLLASLKKLGLGKSMTLGLALSVGMMGAIILIPTQPWLFFILPFLRTGSLFFFWLPYHLFLATEAKINQVGRQLGTIEFFIKLAALLAPLLGALISSSFGFGTTFLVSTLLFVAAASCALTLPNISTKQSWSWRSFFQMWGTPRERLNFVAAGGLIWESIGVSVFWPLFLSIQYASMTAAGYFYALAGFLSLLFTYLSGWIYDHRKKPSFFARVLGSALSLLWIPRLLWSRQPVAIVATDVSDNIVGGMYMTVFFSSLIHQARNHEIYTFYANYEVVVSLTIVMGCLATLFLLFTSWSWSALFLSFLFAGLLSLTFRFSKRE